MPDTVTLQVSSLGSLAEAFAGAPPEAKAFFRRGGSALGKVPPEKYQEVIKAAAENLEAAHLPSKVPSELATALKISVQEAVALLGTASMLVGVITQRRDAVEEIVKAAEAAQFLQAADVPAAVAFAQAIIRDRDAVEASVERGRIAVEVLPSFRRLAATTDVRLGFKEDGISVAVPVVVAHLSTDSDEDLWFQLTKGQLERLIGELESAKRKLEAAQRWIDKSSRGSAPNV